VINSSTVRISFVFPILGFFLFLILFAFDLNQTVFHLINGLSQYTGESLWAALTLLGDPAVILCLALCLVVQKPRIALSILPTLLIGLICVYSLKSFFAIPRPDLVLDSFNLIGASPDSSAFPSGHTTGAIAFATLLLLNYQKTYLHIAIITLSIVVGFSRVAVGAHWPVDIAGGLVLGWLIALIGHFFSRQWQIQRTGERNMGLLLLVAAILLLFKNTGQADLQALQWVISAMAFVVSLTVIFRKPAIAKI